MADMTRRTFAAGGLAGLAPLPSLGAVTGDDGLAGAAERAAELPQLHTLMIVRDGQTVLTRAYRGPAPDRPVNVKSVSKTIVALLTGIAIGRGVLPGPGATLGDLIPRLIPAGADPLVRGITVADLLTMQAGLERTSGPNYGGWISSANWVADALRRPFVAKPGQRFLYSTGSFHVLGAALSVATGGSLLELAREWLGKPLDIEIPAWTRDPQGFYMGGNNMALSPVAMARIGEMVRLGGRWRGREVVPRDWIETSWQPRTRSPFSGDQYGYGWFLTRLGGAFAAYARGYGGQIICVVPDRALTVAITSDPTQPARSAGYFGDLYDLIGKRIVPAAGR